MHSEAEVIVTDEISMVSNKALQNMHERLCEISGCSEANPFACKTIMLFGENLQLHPVKSQHAFVSLNSLFRTICNLWLKFSKCKLTEVM